MATKKQKRELGAQRQLANRKASVTSGLKAQARDRERREKEARNDNAQSQPGLNTNEETIQE